MIFPQYCLFCGKQGDILCRYCKKKLIPSLPECYFCRRLSNRYITHEKCRRKSLLSSVFYGWQYNSNSSKLIKTLKYKGAYSIAEDISELFCSRIISTNFLTGFTNPIFVPIPLHRSKEDERGFNQSEILCHYMSKILNIPYREDILSREISGRAQAEKDKDKRVLLSKDTFVFDDRKYKGEDILLVDDVITTGSTLNSACTAIVNTKCNANISAICLLRGRPFYLSESSLSEELSLEIFSKTSL